MAATAPQSKSPQQKIAPARRPTSADGIIVVDKPAGITSHDVVSRLRRLCGTRAVGHGGTLDPMATGLLVCGIGKGTKLLQFVSGGYKSYLATIRLGIGTNTDDAEGEIVARPGARLVGVPDIGTITDVGVISGVAAISDIAAISDAAAVSEPFISTPVAVSESEITNAIAKLTGDILQVPTTVSAIKVKGERAYALAREGKEVNLEARPISVPIFDVIKIIETKAETPGGEIPVIDLEVEVLVSSGTYVRALARDLGELLRTRGHLTMLRREWIGTRLCKGQEQESQGQECKEQEYKGQWNEYQGIGGFSPADAYTLDELEARSAAGAEIGEALSTMPLGKAAARMLALTNLTDAEASDLQYGRFIAPKYPTSRLSEQLSEINQPSSSAEKPMPGQEPITANKPITGTKPIAGISPDGQLAAILVNTVQNGKQMARPAIVFPPQDEKVVSVQNSASNPMASSDIPSDNIGGNGSVVTFGSFDGVHRGHQALLQEVVRIAKSRDLKSIAFTFDPHPALFHQARPGMQLLVGIDEKVAAIKACGIDEVEVIPYTAEFAAQSPEYFVRDYLNKRYRARVVVLGGDARFGRELSGDLTTLQELGPKYGFELVRFDDVKPAQGAKRWSSTTARAALNDGDMVLVAATLGRLHAITGTVVHGDHRGRELGFPTANLAEITGAVPADGVYAGWLTASVPAAADNAADMAADNAAENTAADGAQAATELRLPAAISIGTNPTFLDGRQRRVEAYVLGRTDLDLYGQQVRLEFLKQVRPTEKFDSVAALIEQMRQDVAQIAALTQPM